MARTPALLALLEDFDFSGCVLTAVTRVQCIKHVTPGISRWCSSTRLRTRSFALAKTDTINAVVTAANGATFLDLPASPLRRSAFVDPLANLPSLRKR